jgi:hypothetical protein
MAKSKKISPKPKSRKSILKSNKRQKTNSEILSKLILSVTSEK